MKSPFCRPAPAFIFVLLTFLLLSFTSAFPQQPAGTCVQDLDVGRGDLNLNGLGHEIADWVIYSNYFLYGDSVLSSDLNKRLAQIANSDVNADARVLRVSDLVRLVLVMNGDVNPIPKTNALATSDTAHFQILQTADSMVIYSNSPEVVRGVFLRLVFPARWATRSNSTRRPVSI